MVNSRKISDLHPIVQQLCNEFISICSQNGIDILITSTFRDKESQDALYAQGRTVPGNIVTKARGGESFHNYRVAFDFVPLVNGKPMWNDTTLFQKCGAIGESIGLTWAGRWTSFRELAHLQYTRGLTLQDLKSGKEL